MIVLFDPFDSANFDKFLLGFRRERTKKGQVGQHCLLNQSFGVFKAQDVLGRNWFVLL